MLPRTMSPSMSGIGAGGRGARGAAGGAGGATATCGAGGAGGTGGTGATWTRTFGTVTTNVLRSETRGLAFASLVPAARSSTAPFNVCMWIDAPPLPIDPAYSRCGLGTRIRRSRVSTSPFSDIPFSPFSIDISTCRIESESSSSSSERSTTWVSPSSSWTTYGPDFAPLSGLGVFDPCRGPVPSQTMVSAARGGSGNVEAIRPFIVEASKSNFASAGSVSATSPLTVWMETSASAGSAWAIASTLPLTVWADTDCRAPRTSIEPLTVETFVSPVEVPHAHVAVDRLQLRGDARRNHDLVAGGDAALVAGIAVAVAATARAASRPHGLQVPAVVVVVAHDLRLLEDLVGFRLGRGRDRERDDGRELPAGRGDDVAGDVFDVDRLSGGDRAVERLDAGGRGLLGLADRDRDEHQQEPEREQDPDGQAIGARGGRLGDVPVLRELHHVHRERETRARHESYAILVFVVVIVRRRST